MKSDRLRILQLAPWSVHGAGTGGMAAVVRDLSSALSQQGHNVQIVTNAWDAPRPRREGAEVRLRLPAVPGEAGLAGRAKATIHVERAARSLLALCRRDGIDVIHAHFAGPYLATLARARALGGPPYIVTCHRGDVLGMPDLTHRQRRVVKEAMQGASASVAVSSWLAQEAEKAFELDAVETIPNGFQLSWTSIPSRAKVEADLGHPLPQQYAVMVANMRPYKGHTVALDAWEIVRETSNLTLVFVGRGPDFEEIQAKADNQGLREHTIFCGHLPRETTHGVMAHATMVVAPSQNEGQGLFALEAGALGRPLVCSDIPPLLDIVENNVSALTFPPTDAIRLAQNVIQLTRNTPLQEKLGNRLKATVSEDFSMRRMVSRYEKIYSYTLREIF